jgi:hypothetical protein
VSHKDAALTVHQKTGEGGMRAMRVMSTCGPIIKVGYRGLSPFAAEIAPNQPAPFILS